MWGIGNTKYNLLAKLVLVLSAILILLTIFLISPVSAFAGGDGSTDNPYQISNIDQLQNMKLDLSAHYVLIDNIDASDTVNWNDGAGFEPIGNTTGYHFTGSFDGNGYEITGFYINRSGTSYIGLFGYTGFGSEIKNVGLVDVDIITGQLGQSYVGALVGYNNGFIESSYATGNVDGFANVGGLAGSNSGTINNSYATGNVNGFVSVGGLVGHNNYGAIENSYATGNVEGNFYVGGLVGDNRGNIENSYATGNVDGWDYVGGLAGSNSGTVNNSYATGGVEGSNWIGGLVGDNRGNIEKSYATGNVNGFANVGGLVGQSRDDGAIITSYATGNVDGSWSVGGLVGNNRGNIENSYATGNVDGWWDYIGGLVGWNSGTIKNSYATGNVNGNDYIGGLVGDNDGGTISNSYWNTETSGLNKSGGGDGRTTEEMTYPHANDTYVEWDFENIWIIQADINDGYPCFHHLHEIGTPNISIQKFINGEHVNEPPGPVIHLGSIIEWKFNVTNNGNVQLTNITVVDDKLGIICEIDELEPGESKVCIVTDQASAKQQMNTVTVTGWYDEIEMLQDTDSAYYFGYRGATSADVPTASGIITVLFIGFFSLLYMRRNH
ncbi:GLUG domain protein [Methanosalsum zhilinae DSM 4017]|uniref:GLUG domain protein n=1 Tax=Methanosalsum zhilinae (strain DSM 4017 / NBRC 107636 / OCM 62 / WeN5) TaxID=679901 RepID=F7XND0_METZD|nr:GLUG motif-containing protein [Methanosalsum zhilinae]AEH61180.1 GLUG domain protein [Methanosalsum zhilinae DSM 4017]